MSEVPKMSRIQSWQVVSLIRCALGEGPVWHVPTRRILWVDIERGIIYLYQTEKDQLEQIAVHQKIGALALVAGGGIVAALKNGFAFIDEGSHKITKIADPEVQQPNNRFNDGKCDPAGRFWAGTMDEVENRRHAGSLYVLHKDLSVTTQLRGVSCSNGLAWSPDGQTFYYIDTPTREVVAYDYEEATGALSNRRVIVHVPQTEGVPDGMTIDSEGMLWIAHWGGWKVIRWNPVTGKPLLEIRLPVAQISACTFGGADMEDLYVTSASTGLDAYARRKQPLAGALFVLKKTGYKGMAPFVFKKG